MEQREEEKAKILLGFPPYSLPSQSQVKAAYRRKVWETHPDRFPPHQKPHAESQFKLISEAYNFLNSSGWSRKIDTTTAAGSYSRSSRVVRTTGVPRTASAAYGGRRNVRVAAASVPFLFIIFCALTLGGSTATRAYRRQKEANPSYNPFLP